MTSAEDYRHLFTTDEFSWKMRMRRGAESFFERSEDPKIQEERLQWLATEPDRYLANTREGQVLIQDCWDLARSWTEQNLIGNASGILDLAKHWETDFLLLDSTSYRLAAGCVCMPSSWDLQESIGKTLTEIHDRVPKLKQQLGHSIEPFLHRIPANQTFFRENWSLTRTSELNYHPSLQRPRLDATTTAEEIFLRIEQQAFVRLNHGVLMGIRIRPVSLLEMIGDREVLIGLRRQLVTMPTEVSDYKGLTRGIPAIIEIIDTLLIQAKPAP